MRKGPARKMGQGHSGDRGRIEARWPAAAACAVLTKQRAGDGDGDGGSGTGVVARSAFLFVAVSFLQTKLKYLAQHKKWRSNLHL